MTNASDPVSEPTQPPVDLQLLTQKAVDAALKRQWDSAISINTQLLTVDTQNVDALNRIGFAYLNNGDTKEAKKMFTKVKTIDPYNQIATKNLKKIETLGEGNHTKLLQSQTVSPLSFLEDPGKTKLVECVNVAPVKLLSQAHCGQEVYLKSKNHSVEIRDAENTYLAALPDDISFRMLKLIEGGNTYQVIIKSLYKSTMTVLIRELSRGKKFASQPSFITNIGYQSYGVSAATDIDKPDVTPTGEDDSEEKASDTLSE